LSGNGHKSYVVNIMTDCCRGWCTIAMNVGPVYAGYTYRSVSSSVVAVVYKFIHSHNVSKCRHASLQPAQMTQIVKSPGILIRTYFITRACSNPNIGSLLLWEIGSCFVAMKRARVSRFVYNFYDVFVSF
jgi:hypothetical protein